MGRNFYIWERKAPQKTKLVEIPLKESGAKELRVRGLPNKKSGKAVNFTTLRRQGKRTALDAEKNLENGAGNRFRQGTRKKKRVSEIFDHCDLGERVN